MEAPCDMIIEYLDSYRHTGSRFDDINLQGSPKFGPDSVTMESQYLIR